MSRDRDPSERSAVALERIADALEYGILDGVAAGRFVHVRTSAQQEAQEQAQQRRTMILRRILGR